MSNNINSQLTHNINKSAFEYSDMSFAAKASERYVEAPQYLPKFSITQSLNEKDEFRKQAIKASSNTKKQKNTFKKLLIAALTGAAAVLGYKKLIK